MLNFFLAMVLQESDMFMDALTASTKSKEPRKRKRRTSITKDGPTEAKKQEIANTDNSESTPPPSSPSNVEEKSPVALKPNFKVMQTNFKNAQYYIAVKRRNKLSAYFRLITCICSFLFWNLS